MENNILEELEEAYKSYKKSEYIFGKYGAGEQIEKACMEGKIFVLKANKKVFIGFIALLAPFIFPFTIAEGFIIILISVLIADSIVGILLLILSITYIRSFIVIGPSGFYYRKVVKKRFFQWKDVTLAQASIHTTMGGYRRRSVTTGRVVIKIPNKHQLTFDSTRYRSKEFVRKVKRMMFIRLFEIYYKLANKKL
ncbi:MAG: hypothetical protein ACFFA7_14995 [Promethearchaeota archaeon]